METTLMVFLLILIFNIFWLSIYGLKNYLEFYNPSECKIALLLYLYNALGVGSLIIIS
jgi:hypothetical protein